MGRIPRLNIDNQLSNLTQVVNDQVDIEDLTLQMIAKMKLITKLHESLLENVDQAHDKQKWMYAARKWHIMFHSFGEGEVYMKMCKPRKKNHLVSWEGPYLFVGYKDKKRCQEHDIGARI